jgi:hypothetical protein
MDCHPAIKRLGEIDTMETALRHHHVAAGRPVARRSDPARTGTLQTALQASVAVLIGALLISVLMVASILLAGPATTSNPGPMPEPAPRPIAAAGLDR